MVEALRPAIQGLQQSSLNVSRAAERIANPNSNSDLASDLVDVKINENSFAANAQVVATTSDLQETLIEALGQNLDIQV